MILIFIKPVKALTFVLAMLCVSPLMAGSYQDLQDDIDDLKSTIRRNEMNRMLEKMIDQNASNARPVYKRKYFNGICRLQWVNGYGLVEIPGEIKGQAIYMLESRDAFKIPAELYIDKSTPRKSVEALIDTYQQQIYQMCK